MGCTRIRCLHFEYFARLHCCQRLLGTQNWERAVHANSIYLEIELDGIAHLEATQSFTPAKAAPNLLGSVPPAIAISGLPPPLPPTC